MPRKAREEFRDLRIKAIVVLGGKCAACGIQDERVLQFDHVVPLAKQGRSKNREPTWQAAKAILAGDLTTYQILCANCNTIKALYGSEGGVTKPAETVKLTRPQRHQVRNSPLSADYWAKRLGVPIQVIVSVRT